MKELSIEEKAKAYDEALARANEMIKSMTNIGGVAKVDDIQHIFPELKESEDERIRKIIYGWIYTQPSEFFEGGFSKEEMLTWLEKQGHDGKKWIYEDVYIKEKEQLIQDGIDEVLENPQKYGLEKQGEQKPASCSKEDEKQARQIERIVHDGCTQKLQKQIADWFESLKERYTWKPSDEQIIELHRVISGCSYDIEPLVEIEEHLKKLREE